VIRRSARNASTFRARAGQTGKWQGRQVRSDATVPADKDPQESVISDETRKVDAMRTQKKVKISELTDDDNHHHHYANVVIREMKIGQKCIMLLALLFG